MLGRSVLYVSFKLKIMLSLIKMSDVILLLVLAVRVCAFVQLLC